MQVLAAQDRILDEQNIVGDLAYSTAIFIDQANKVTQHNALMPLDCGGTPSCGSNYYCANIAKNRACFMDQSSNRVDFIAGSGRFKVQKGGTTYDIISNDVSFTNVIVSSSTDRELILQIEATGDPQYNQKVYYQNYITK